jgi:hypothetical protein
MEATPAAFLPRNQRRCPLTLALPLLIVRAMNGPDRICGICRKITG